MNVVIALIAKEIWGAFWKTLALVTIAVAIVVSQRYSGWTGVPTDGVSDGLHIALIGQAIFGGIFLSMHVTSVERADGTIDFIRSLPVSLWIVGLVRIAVNWLALMAPLLVAGIIAQMFLWQFPQQTFGLPNVSIWKPVLLASIGATGFYLWNLAIAMNQPTEIRAGAIGLVILLVSFALLITVSPSYIARSSSVFSPSMLSPGDVLGWDLSTEPSFDPDELNRLFDTRPQRQIQRTVTAAIVAAVLDVLLLLVAIRRYGHVQSVLVRPRWTIRSPATAWLWFHLQQAWPLGAASCVVGFFVMYCVTTSNADQAMALTWAIGTVWSVVAGVVLFISDLEPRLSAFWRSRPISPSAWFWSKFAVGWLFLCILVDGPYIVASAGTSGFFGLALLAVHTALLAISVLVTCLVRQPVYAGILSFFGGAGLVAAMVAVLINERGLRTYEALMHTLAHPSTELTAARLFLLVLPAMLGTVAVIGSILFTARWAVVKDVSLMS